MRLGVRLALAAVLALPAGGALAQEGAARSAATSIMQALGARRYQAVYDNQTSSWFKQRVSAGSFAANMTMTRASLGGLSSSQVVDSTHFNRDPQIDREIDAYAFNFENRYAAGRFYERVVVMKEEDGSYRLSGYFGAPAQ